MKTVDPNETYEVMELLSCGEGHFLTPGFTHWEEGEVCPFGHSSDASNADVHLYYRKLLIPTTDSQGRPIKEMISENRGKWGQTPVAV